MDGDTVTGAGRDPSRMFANKKGLHDITLGETLAYCEAGGEAGFELDRLIWYKIVFDPALEEKGEDAWLAKLGSGTPAYTRSLDAAKKTYLTVPERMPSDPMAAVIEGLRQRVEAQ